MKILLLNNGFAYHAINFAKSIRRYFDEVHIANIDITTSNYSYECSEEDKEFFVAKAEPKEYDCVFGLSQSSILTLYSIKQALPNILCGVQILDYPKHVFLDTKDFQQDHKRVWEIFFNHLSELDFVVSNQFNAIKHIEKYNSNVDFIRYPVKPIEHKEVKRENIIVYSGRITPDKGVHYIIDALGVIEEKPHFITIGKGYDFRLYASSMNVEYTNITNCSEEDKFKFYHSSKFLICGADNPYIPSLCILEGISINRAGLVFYTPENELHYGDNVKYAFFRDIGSLASEIKTMLSSQEETDKIAENGKEFVENNCTYEIWGDRVNSMIDKCKEGK